jgi:hypothetical protein
MSQAKRYDDAKLHFKYAIKTYLENRAGLVDKNGCALAITNLFKTILHEGAEKFTEKAKAELKEKEYGDLKEELALAAVKYPRLAPILHEIEAGNA